MTLDDVAKAAGVSPKTVSRVLNNEPNVRGATRDKVLAAAEQLGYRPNPAARSLASSKSYTITHLHANPNQDYIAQANSGLYEVCRKHNYLMFAEPLEDEQEDIERRVETFLTSLRTDGVILTAPLTDHESLLELLRRKRIPVVSISPTVERNNIASVAVDDKAASALMTKHIVSLGHRSIGYISGPTNHGSSALRKEGFFEIIRQAGIPESACHCEEGDYTFRSGLVAAKRILSGSTKPTAIFAANDLMAAGAMTASFQAGYAVPEQISIAGIDASYVGSILWPPLCTIRQPVNEMAKTAANWLISGELFENDRPKRKMFETTLVDRASMAAVPQ